MENKKNAERKKQEDIALTRALSWFGAAMVLEFLLLLVNKYYVNFTADSASIALALAMSTVVKVTTALGLIGAVVCGFFGWKRYKASGTLPFLWLVLTVALLALGVCSGLIVLFYRAAVDLLYILVPAAAVLALVYYLYQKEFFFSACSIGVGLLGLWLVRKNSGTHDLLVTLYAVAGTVVLLAVLLLVLKLKKAQAVLHPVQAEQLPAHVPVLHSGCAGSGHRPAVGQHRGVLPAVCVAGLAVRPAGLLHRQDDVTKSKLHSQQGVQLFYYPNSFSFSTALRATRYSGISSSFCACFR